MNQRYEREIDELLLRLEERSRQGPRARQLSRTLQPYLDRLRQALAAFLRRPPTEQFMISAMVLVLISFFMSAAGLVKWAGYASVLSIVLFILGIGIALVGRHSPRYHKTWRGRELYGPSYGPTLWQQLRSWLRRRGR